MHPLRKELQEYSSSCEHLLSAVASPHSTPFTHDEIELIAYYADEMTNLVDQLLRRPQLQQYQNRQTVREYARACEALLLLSDLSEEERESIRSSISEVTAKILHSCQAASSDGGH